MISNTSSKFIQGKFIGASSGISGTVRKSNPIGYPVQRANLSTLFSSTYKLDNSQTQATGQVKFAATVEGESLPFEIVNVGVDATGYYEREPRPDAAMHLIYQNDTFGNAARERALKVIVTND